MTPGDRIPVVLGAMGALALGAPAYAGEYALLEAPREAYSADGAPAVMEERLLAPDDSNVGYGPLRLGLQSPGQSLRLGLTPRAPTTLPEGGIEVLATGTWVNIWGYDEGDGYRVDGEQLQTAFGLGFGLTDSVQVGLEYLLRMRFGGVMDGFIEGFHDALGLDQGGRDEFPKNDLAVEFEARPGREAYSKGRDDLGFYASQLQLSVQHRITRGDDMAPALAWSLTLASDLGNSEAVSSTDGTNRPLYGAARVPDPHRRNESSLLGACRGSSSCSATYVLTNWRIKSRARAASPTPGASRRRRSRGSARRSS